jgi:type II secretory pathway pseudopilin PulG
MKKSGLIRYNYSNAHKYAKGLTLLEITVALVILSMVIGGLLSVFTAAKRQIMHSSSRSAGGELGTFFLDRFQMQVRADTWGTNCLGTGTLANCPNLTQGTADGFDRNYDASYTVTPNFACSTLTRVLVTLTWNETF